MNWTITGAAIITGTAVMGALLYFLLKKEDEEEDKAISQDTVVAAKSGEMDLRNVRVADLSKEDVLKVLEDMIQMQEANKEMMRKLVKDLVETKGSFAEAYERAKEFATLESFSKNMIALDEMDTLLQMYCSDPVVAEAITRLMGSPDQNSSKNIEIIPMDTLMAIHRFMLAELKLLMKTIEKSKSKANYDTYAVTLAVQAFVNAKIEDKFNVDTEAVEISTTRFHPQLSANSEFIRLSLEMQSEMSQFIGNSYS